MCYLQFPADSDVDFAQAFCKHFYLGLDLGVDRRGGWSDIGLDIQMNKVVFFRRIVFGLSVLDPLTVVGSVYGIGQ